jgi:serine/threonine-protein kinase
MMATWSQISPYLDQALDLAPDDRDVWLRQLARTQRELATVLRELVAQRDILDAKGFLARSLLALPDHDSSSMARQRVGAYTVERLIGRGGMGEVWLASRGDGRLEARCAVKFLNSFAIQPRLASRFRREGRLLARLGHPNIARLIDAGTTDDGRQFLLLEYVDGQHIDLYCDSMALKTEARVELFVDAVSAVAHAHNSLIVHRDLKPANVLVTHDGVVKLLDFGIAKLLHPELASSDPESTRPGEVALTPEYAAPEQLLGDTPTTATDVYQLGLLLLVLLTGRHPLRTYATRADGLRAMLDGRLPRASDLVGGTLREQLRGDLDAILETALHNDPSQRYPTAAALREALVRYLKKSVP